jgi:hypothetical protein
VTALDVVLVIVAAGAGVFALMQAAAAARTTSALRRYASADDAGAAITAYARTCVSMCAVAAGYFIAAATVPAALVAGAVIGLAVAIADHRLSQVLKPQRRAAASLVRAAQQSATAAGQE